MLKSSRAVILMSMGLVILALSCVRHEAEDGVGSNLVIDARVLPTPTAKAVVEGSAFKTGNDIGIFVYHSETSDPEHPSPMEGFSLYGPRYRNIKGIYDQSSPSKPWSFMFEGANNRPFSDIYLLKPSISVFEEGLAVLAYAPWIQGSESIERIPFTLGGESKSMPDLMWARQNTHDVLLNNVDPGKNYKIIPDGTAKPVVLTFRHALSLLKIGFRCKYEGSKMSVSSISLRRGDGSSAPLWTSAYFNAVNGTVVEGSTSEVLSYDYSGESYDFGSGEYEYVPMLICPYDYQADGDYVLEFRFNSVDPDEEIPTLSYPIRKADLKGGFEAGKVYHFKFTLDNYIQFDGVNVSDTWEGGEDNNEEFEF